VHHGMLGAAEWAVKHARPVLKNDLVANPGKTTTILQIQDFLDNVCHCKHGVMCRY
jgi:hypothetical protein